MKKLAFISLLCTLLFMASSVSYGAAIKCIHPGIENIGNSPPAINPVWNIADNWIPSSPVNPCNTGGPAQTHLACDKANTAPTVTGYAALVDRFLTRSERGYTYNNKSAINTSREHCVDKLHYIVAVSTGWSQITVKYGKQERCNANRKARDGISCSVAESSYPLGANC